MRNLRYIQNITLSIQIVIKNRYNIKSVPNHHNYIILFQTSIVVMWESIYLGTGTRNEHKIYSRFDTMIIIFPERTCVSKLNC